MGDYSNENRWALFKNDRKQQDNHPDYTGSINVNGVDYFLNGWLKEKDGRKYFSGTIKPKGDKPLARSTEHRPGIDDDIPF